MQFLLHQYLEGNLLGWLLSEPLDREPVNSTYNIKIMMLREKTSAQLVNGGRALIKKYQDRYEEESTIGKVSVQRRIGKIMLGMRH